MRLSGPLVNSATINRKNVLSNSTDSNCMMREGKIEEIENVFIWQRLT